MFLYWYRYWSVWNPILQASRTLGTPSTIPESEMHELRNMPSLELPSATEVDYLSLDKPTFAEPVPYPSLSASARYFAENLEGCPTPCTPVSTPEEKRKFANEVITFLSPPDRTSFAGERQSWSFARWTQQWNLSLEKNVYRKTEKHLRAEFRAPVVSNECAIRSKTLPMLPNSGSTGAPSRWSSTNCTRVRNRPGRRRSQWGAKQEEAKSNLPNVWTFPFPW